MIFPEEGVVAHEFVLDGVGAVSTNEEERDDDDVDNEQDEKDELLDGVVDVSELHFESGCCAKGLC